MIKHITLLPPGSMNQITQIINTCALKDLAHQVGIENLSEVCGLTFCFSRPSPVAERLLALEKVGAAFAAEADVTPRETAFLRRNFSLGRLGQREESPVFPPTIGIIMECRVWMGENGNEWLVFSRN